jgi:hypothetical protein
VSVPRAPTQPELALRSPTAVALGPADFGGCRLGHSKQLAWRQATHAIVGFSLAVCDKNILPHKIDEAVVNLSGMVGVDRTEGWEVAKRPCPELPGE